MNARQMIAKLDGYGGIIPFNSEELEVTLRALRLLAAAEANDGTTPETDEFAEHDFVLEAIECHSMILERLKAWRDSHAALERERNGLAARVVELEKDAERSSKKIDFLRLELFSETTARKSAENELFAAIQDADRYRWLRVQRHADIAACWYLPVMPQDYPVDTPEERDAPIDAARGSKP